MSGDAKKVGFRDWPFTFLKAVTEITQNMLLGGKLSGQSLPTFSSSLVYGGI